MRERSEREDKGALPSHRSHYSLFRCCLQAPVEGCATKGSHREHGEFKKEQRAEGTTTTVVRSEVALRRVARKACGGGLSIMSV